MAADLGFRGHHVSWVGQLLLLFGNEIKKVLETVFGRRVCCWDIVGGGGLRSGAGPLAAQHATDIFENVARLFVEAGNVIGKALQAEPEQFAFVDFGGGAFEGARNLNKHWEVDKFGVGWGICRNQLDSFSDAAADCEIERPVKNG